MGPGGRRAFAPAYKTWPRNRAARIGWTISTHPVEVRVLLAIPSFILQSFVAQWSRRIGLDPTDKTSTAVVDEVRQTSPTILRPESLPRNIHPLTSVGPLADPRVYMEEPHVGLLCHSRPGAKHLRKRAQRAPTNHLFSAREGSHGPIRHTHSPIVSRRKRLYSTHHFLLRFVGSCRPFGLQTQTHRHFDLGTHPKDRPIE